MIPQGYKLTIQTADDGLSYEATLLNIRSKGTVSATGGNREDARDNVLRKFHRAPSDAFETFPTVETVLEAEA